MARQFDDGFDVNGNNVALPIGFPWSSTSGGFTPETITSDARFAPPSGLPGGCLLIGGGQAWIRGTTVGNQATLIAMFGYKTDTLPGSGSWDIFSFLDSGNYQCSLSVTANGALQFWRGNGSGSPQNTQIGASTPNGTIQPNVWYGIILVVTFNGSTGSVTLYLNGSSTTAIASTALNTAPSGNNWANMVQLGSGTSITFRNQKYDDFALWDITGSVNNAAPLTDVRIISKVPSAAGNYTNWTPNGLASNWQNVSQMPANSADYNANNTPGTKDSYHVPSAGLTVAPLSVTVRASLWRDDAGPHTPSLMVRSGTTDGVGAALAAIPSSPAFFDTQFVNDPATSSPFTAAGADAIEIGVVEG